MKTLVYISNELKPNGGNSIKDKVDAIHTQQATLQADFVLHTADDERRFKKIQKQLRRIESGT